jgi:glutaconate CoA-transferase, subunit A
MFISLETLAEKIEDGAKLAIPADYAGIAMSATRALIRRGAKDLHIIGVPTSGFQSEILIGAGCVTIFESSALTMGEYNPPPRFSVAVKNKTIQLIDATCPAIHAALQASQKGLPFMPLRGLLGSDLMKYHPDWIVMQNPFEKDEDPIVAVKAIKPDVALFHAPLADRDGNVWVGRRRELVNMAQASKTALITVEEVTDKCLLDDEKMAAGVLPNLYIGGISHAPKGSWPLGFWQGEPEDSVHLNLYKAMAKDDAGFAEYLQTYILDEAQS